jgi:hypothetical protein
MLFLSIIGSIADSAGDNYMKCMKLYINDVKKEVIIRPGKTADPIKNYQFPGGLHKLVNA